MDTAKLFTNGKSQAVRLPKAYRIKGKEAFITKIGNAILLFPKQKGWDTLFSSLDKFSDDFLSERVQPDLEKRDSLFL